MQELAADAERQVQFNGMLAYANSKDWIDEAANRVEAHIQPLGWLFLATDESIRIVTPVRKLVAGP